MWDRYGYPSFLFCVRDYLRCLVPTAYSCGQESLLVSSLNMYVKVESGVVDLLLILAAAASRDDRLPGRTE
jgi:hypothetical protein